jgi:radical SAM superfamily enzyme YgiQ (UPF0313 family)
MKVLLLNPHYLQGYIHSARWDSLTVSGSHWYPIFLAYATGLLEQSGHECRLIDAEADNLTDQEVLNVANDFKPDFTVVYISQKGLIKHQYLSSEIKTHTNSRIIFVGPWCSMPQVKEFCLKDKKSKPLVDHLIDGEFEFAVKDIVEGKENKKIITAGRLTSEQLNELPWVTKVYNKHLNIENYQIGSLWHPFVDMFTGRKCYWGKCTFCLWPSTIFKTGGYIARDIDDVLDEMGWAVKNIKPKIKEIYIQDDTPPAWRCKQLAEGIIERKIDIAWSTYARGDLTLTSKILKLMKKSGCHCLHVGYESGSNKILKKINKGVTREMLEKFTNLCNDASIDVHADFMIGLPGETEKTARETIEWAKKLNVVTYQFAPPKPYPCTPYYDWLIENELIDEKGRPEYKEMSYKEMVDWCKIAMKECYFNFGFLKRVIFKPNELKRLIRSAIFVIPYILKNTEKQLEEEF